MEIFLGNLYLLFGVILMLPVIGDLGIILMWILGYFSFLDFDFYIYGYIVISYLLFIYGKKLVFRGLETALI